MYTYRVYLVNIIYIYIERERESETVHIYIYIYTLIIEIGSYRVFISKVPFAV